MQRKKRLENRILKLLPPDEHRRLTTRMTRVSLSLGEVVYDRGAEIRHVYFPISVTFSTLVVLDDGSSIDSSTVGKEGVAGVPVLLGNSINWHRTVAQVAGESWRIAAGDLKTVVGESKTLRDLLSRYSAVLLEQTRQNVACALRHSTEQRMARWLLASSDRAESKDFPLTHEFLAEMLGVGRPTVTISAGILQRAGLISHTRGRLKILDETMLRGASCGCYAATNEMYDRFLRQPNQ